MAHNVVFHDGADHQEISSTVNRYLAVSGTLPTLESTLVYPVFGARSRAYKWLCSATTGYLEMSNQATRVAGKWVAGTLGNEARHSFFMRIVTLPGAGQYVYLWSTDGLNRFHVRLREDGKLDAGAEGTWDATSAAAMAINTWYLVSISTRASGLSCSVTVRNPVDGSTVASVSRNASGNWTAARIGPWSSSTGTVIIDNLVQESGAAASIDDPYNLLGRRYAEVLLLPTAVGNYNDYTGAFGDVDEAPNDGDTTFRSQTGTGAANFSQTCEDLSAIYGGKTVHCVAVLGVQRLTSSGISVNCGTLMRLSGSDASDTMDFTSTTSYTLMQSVRPLDPGGGAWSIADLDALEIGATRGTSGVGREHRATNALLLPLVEFAPFAPSQILSMW